MSKNSQRQDRQARKKAEKRRKEKLREKKQLVQSLTNRLEVRLGKQMPQAWQGELPQDVALFDEAVLAQLPAEEAGEAQLVRNVLTEVWERRQVDNVESLSTISRRSPFSEWRMFVRGLVAWQAGNLDAATEAWSRLDQQRRPWRMAASLVLSHRSNLTELKLDGSSSDGTASDAWVAAVDGMLLNHAKLVRQTQVERVALRAARGILKIPLEAEDATIGPAQVAWLREFSKDYRSVEPDLVQGLHEVAIRRAFGGVYVDMFRDCAQYFRGPRHDRNNSLTKYYWQLKTQSPQPEKQLDDYLKVQLPQNKELSDSLRAAIASELHCWLAQVATEPQAPSNPFSFFAQPTNNVSTIARHYENALKACPGNYNAYDGYESLYVEQLDDDNLSVDERRGLESKLAAIRKRRVTNFPGNVETRLALVDYLLENDQSDEAKSHIKVLAGTRTDNPLADAMAWKWNILEAMRLSRRKTSLAPASQHLSEAEQEWPRWLSKEWLPYLRAALQVRAGQSTAFDEMPESSRSPSKVADACMRLGAAQRMSVAAADLKPLRQAVEASLTTIDQLTAQDLLPLASYFWDLERCGLKYPAMRMHSRKFLGPLLDLLLKDKELPKRLDEPPIRASLLFMAHQGFFLENYSVRLPEELRAAKEHPLMCAIVLAAAMRVKWVRDFAGFSVLAEQLRKDADVEPAVYDRWLYRRLADRYDEKHRRADRGLDGGFFSRFTEMLERGMMDDEDFDDDDFDDDDVAEICNCDDCRRERGEIK